MGTCVRAEKRFYTQELLEARDYLRHEKFILSEKLKRKESGYIKNKIKENESLLDKYFNKKSFGICSESSYLNGMVNGVKKYAKIVPCGKELCPVCGQKDSLLHRQNFARGIYKMLSRKTLGYFVFTLPEEFRKDFLSQGILRDFTSYIIKLLKKDVEISYEYEFNGKKYGFQEIIKGYDKGYTRWHFSGDIGKKCYKPHLNVLVGRGAWIDKEKLIAYREYFNNEVNKWIQLNLDYKFNKKLDINYSYRNTINKVVHTFKYVVRPTMLNIGTEDLMFCSIKLKNFRRVRWWGKWEVYKWVKEKINSEALKLFNDDDVKWEFVGKLKDNYNDIMSMEYLGFGIFRNNTG